MNKDATDFMLEEYDHIATAFFSLQTQLTEWFKAYLCSVIKSISLFVTKV